MLVAIRTSSRTSIPKLLIKGEDKDLIRSAGTQMTSRALFPESHYRMCSSKMRRKPRKKIQAWKASRPGWSRAAKNSVRMPPMGGNGANIFRHSGVVDGHKVEVLEHVE